MKTNIKTEIQSFLEQHLISENITTNEILEMVQDISKATSNKIDEYQGNNTKNQSCNYNKPGQTDSENLFAPLKDIIGKVFEKPNLISSFGDKT